MEAGKVSAEIAKLHAETEFEKYRYSCAYIGGLGGIKKNSTRIYSTADCIPVKV